MSFMEGLSKLAKSVGDGAAAVAKKSGNAVEIAKTNMDISTEEDKIQSVYKNIGKVIVERYKEGQQFDEQILSECIKVTEYEENISKLKEKISLIKKIKICPNCKAELDFAVEFCPKCGAKQEIIAEETVETEKTETDAAPAPSETDEKQDDEK